MGVPYLEGGLGVCRRLTITSGLLGSQPTAQGFEQCVALAQDALIVSAYASQPWPPRNDEVIEEASAFTGIALDDGNVSRREHHRPQYTDDFPSLTQRRTIEPGAIGFPWVDLELQRQPSRVVEGRLHTGPHDGTHSARPNQRHLGSHPMRVHRRQVFDGLNKVGLALPIGSDECRYSRLKW